MTAVYMVRLDSESVSYVMSGASEYVSLPHLRPPYAHASARHWFRRSGPSRTRAKVSLRLGVGGLQESRLGEGAHLWDPLKVAAYLRGECSDVVATVRLCMWSTL